MKKRSFLLVLFALMLAVPAFSADWFISIDTSCPMTSEKSVGVGIQSRCMFNGFIGMHTSADFIVPFYMITGKPGDYEYVVGFDAMVGPAIQIVNTTYFRLVLIAGGNVYSTIAEKTLENNAEFNFGPAANISTEFSFGKNFYITAGLSAFMDCYGIKIKTDHVTKEREATEYNTILIGFQPRLGFGYKF